MRLSKEFRDGTCRLCFGHVPFPSSDNYSGTGKKLHLRVTTFASFQFYVQCANV